jgi:hypothetical protein
MFESTGHGVGLTEMQTVVILGSVMYGRPVGVVPFVE